MKYISSIVNKVNKGQLSAVSIAKKCIENIEKNKKYNIFTQVNNAFILEQAENIDQKVKDFGFAGKLAGVTVAIKDNLHVKEFKTTCCSKFLINYFPNTDADIVKTLKKEGAIIVGKTNMDEFAAGFTTSTSCFGATLNPHDTNCSPGGSSGGSAVAVQTEIVNVAIGTDTGGSIRQPAALTGVIGYKPTFGSISRQGMVPLASSLDTIGFFAKNIRDIKYISSITMHSSKSDMLSHQTTSVCPNISNKKNIRLALINTWRDSETEKGFQIFIKKLESDNNVEIKIINIDSLKLCVGAYAGLCFSELYTNTLRFDNSVIGSKSYSNLSYEDAAKTSRDECFGSELKSRCLSGAAVLTEKTPTGNTLYETSLLCKYAIKKEFSDYLSKYDAIISPTTPNHKIYLNKEWDEEMDSSQEVCSSHHPDALTTPANFNRSPSISIPYAFTSSRIPLGIIINSASNKDNDLLDIAEFMTKISKFDS